MSLLHRLHLAYSFTGYPAVVVRTGTTVDGLPVGVQVVARPWRDDVALAVAAYLEERLGVGNHRRWQHDRTACVAPTTTTRDS